MFSVVDLGSGWTVLPVVMLGLVALLGLGEWLRSIGVRAVHTRRLVHSGVALTAAGLPLIFHHALPVYVLAMLFVAGNAAAKHVHWWPSIHEARPESWGTVTMPAALIVGLAGTWSVTPDRIVVLQAAFVVLAVADPLAAWTGQRHGKWQVWPGTTVLGSTVFFLCTAALIGAFLVSVMEWEGARIVGASLLGAGVATAAEAISRRGLDNVSIVLSVLLVLVPLQEGTVTVVALVGALAIGIAFVGLAYGASLLTGPGAVGGGLLGAMLVGLGGTSWVVPGLTFFGLSSALSVLPTTRTTAEERERRTLRQVLANGGVAWGLLAVSTLGSQSAPLLQMGCYLGFLGALAAAAADTWATELGTRYAGRPWSLRTFQRAAPGTSGAVSLVGTIGAVLGAASIAGAAYVAAGEGQAMLITGAGVAGMTVDSLLGAIVQARYYDPDVDALVEHPVEGDDSPIQGWAFVENEVVNLCGTGSGAVVAAGTIVFG